MKKLLLLGMLLAPLPLAGCANLTNLTNTVQGLNVTPKEVYIAANAFDAAKATVTNYLLLPVCPQAAVCRDPKISHDAAVAIRVGTSARNQLESYVTANPGQPVPVMAYQTLQTVTTTLQVLIDQYSSK